MAGWVVPELTACHFDRPSLGRGTVTPFENEVDLIALLMALCEGVASLTDKIEDADNNERLPSWPDEAFDMLLAKFLGCAPHFAQPSRTSRGEWLSFARSVADAARCCEH